MAAKLGSVMGRPAQHHKEVCESHLEKLTWHLEIISTAKAATVCALLVYTIFFSVLFQDIYGRGDLKFLQRKNPLLRYLPSGMKISPRQLNWASVRNIYSVMPWCLGNWEHQTKRKSKEQKCNLVNFWGNWLLSLREVCMSTSHNLSLLLMASNQIIPTRV